MRAKDFITEVPLPSDWDPKKLNLNQTFKDRLDYALARAKRLGGGSSRVAMIIEYQGRPTVLKIAKNPKGLAQNKAEIDILKDAHMGKLPIVIPLIDYDKANSTPVWLQTEIAKKVTELKLVELLCTPDMDFLLDTVELLLSRKNRNYRTIESIKKSYYNYYLPKEAIKRYTKQGFIEEVRENVEQDWKIFTKYANEMAYLTKLSNIEINDLVRASNWGLYNNRPVIIDIGLTSDTKHLYGFSEDSNTNLVAANL